jgi:hypothetical protein
MEENNWSQVLIYEIERMMEFPDDEFKLNILKQRLQEWEDYIKNKKNI